LPKDNPLKTYTRYLLTGGLR